MSNVENPIGKVSGSGPAGYWVAGVAATVGAALAVDLTRLHYLVERDPSHQSYCNINETVNCDAVAKSAYSMLLGVPVALWGLLAYGVAIALSVWGLRTRRAAPALLLLVVGCVCTLSALVLAYLSAFVIHSYCLECAASWGVDVTVLVSGFLLVRRYSFRACLDDVTRYAQTKLLHAAALGIGVLLVFGMVARLLSQSPLSSTVAVASSAPVSQGKGSASGINAAGHPYIGAERPKVTIEEYSDYQCPYCSKAHAQLRLMVSRYPDSIQLIHRHFPLDNDCNRIINRPFHTHACYYAKLAVCAATLHRFWEANDFLFLHGHDEAPVAVETLAREIGVKGVQLQQCLSDRASELLKIDIEDGIALKIDGTPTFVINGEKVIGALPEALLQQYPL